MTRRDLLKRLAALPVLAAAAPALAVDSLEAVAEQLPDEIDCFYKPGAEPEDMLVPPGEWLLVFQGRTMSGYLDLNSGGWHGLPVEIRMDGEWKASWVFDSVGWHGWSWFHVVRKSQPTQFTVDGSSVDFTRINLVACEDGTPWHYNETDDSAKFPKFPTPRESITYTPSTLEGTNLCR
jgi:hypothetical protein